MKQKGSAPQLFTPRNNCPAHHRARDLIVSEQSRGKDNSTEFTWTEKVMEKYQPVCKPTGCAISQEVKYVNYKGNE